MGKFINTERTEILNSLVTGFKDRLKNPYYLHLNKPATVTTLYNLNVTASTLDEGLKIIQAETGNNSPLRYNKIEGFYLYGIEQIQVQLENGEFGLEGNSIDGEAIVLPNTVIPYPNAFFLIDYLDTKYLFKIIDVTYDTLENGANFYKIAYHYDSVMDPSDLEPNVIETYKMLINNVGTEFSPIIRVENYNFAEIIEDVLIQLKKYFKAVYYSPRVETFVYNDGTDYFYDPYLIEFIVRNKLMDGDREFVYISQQMALPTTFLLDYDKSFFRSVEIRKNTKLSDKTRSVGTLINQPLSTLSYRKEPYFSLTHVQANYASNLPKLVVINDILYDSIKYNFLNTYPSLENIIVKYFYNKGFNADDIAKLSEIEFDGTTKMFYYIPILIYILEYQLKLMLKTGELLTSDKYVTVGETVNTEVGYFTDMNYTYFVITEESQWKVNRYDTSNNQTVGTSITEITTLTQCQALTYN